MIRFFPNFMALDVIEWGVIPKGRPMKSLVVCKASQDI
jgi:hypothetical protein